MAFNNFFIIDDDIEDSDLLVEALALLKKNSQCYVASNGEEALKKLNANIVPAPDFIFLDLNMPRLNGIQFLVEIKESCAFRNIPIVIYTTSSSPRDREETKRLGAYYFLTKPNTFDEICKAVNSILTMHNVSVEME